MSWQVFEEDKPQVAQALQEGRFDYMEVVAAVEERRFFRRLLEGGVLEGLAREYPSPRRKEEVPLWLYLASELTLRLHGANGFGAYPYILHCGGLVDALGPDQVERNESLGAQKERTIFRGYNHKNHYTRVTPCDADFLRKMSKDTDPEALEAWFGTSGVRAYREMGALDPEGLFFVDSTYIFVPLDNERYEGSSLLRFHEDGRPVDAEAFEALPPEQKARCAWRRCYRQLKLTHSPADGGFSLCCGSKVLPGKASDVPWVGPLVERCVGALGPRAMKLLVHDRGLVDGETVSRLKGLGVDSLFPLKRGMDVWEDAKVLAAYEDRAWRRYDLPRPAPPPIPKDRPPAVARREAQRQRTLQARGRAPCAPARALTGIEYQYVEPSRVWERRRVPVTVLLIKNHYAHGETLDWALASTREFPDPLQMWTTYRLRPVIEEDHRQDKCFWDMTPFRSPALAHVVNRIVFVELAASLIQIFLRQVERSDLVGRTRQRLLDALRPNQKKIALYCDQRFGLFDPYEYQELLLTLRDGARRKVLGKTRRLRRSQQTPPDLPWRPE